MASQFHLSQQSFALQKSVMANGQQHTLMIFAQSITVTASTGGVISNAAPHAQPQAQKPASKQISNVMKQLPAPKPTAAKAEIVAEAKPASQSNKPEWFSNNSRITTIDPETTPPKPAAPKIPNPLASIFGNTPKPKPEPKQPPKDKSTDFWNRPSWA